MSRRTLHKILLTGPAAALASARPAAQPAAPSARAACLAASETTFTAVERDRLAKAIGGLEQSLKAIRDFKVPADADPAMRFQPMQSRRVR
jgi:hypothetical protein